MEKIFHAPWAYDVPPFQITDNLFFVGNSDLSVHLIDTGSGLILIDTAYPQTANLLLESIRLLGFDPRNIKYILHTHSHYDHIGATRMLVEKYGCRTFMGAKDADFLTQRTALTWHQEFGIEYHEFFELDVPVREGNTVALGSTSIECIEAPGHTPGTMTYRWLTAWNGKPYYAAITGGFGVQHHIVRIHVQIPPDGVA